MKYENVDFNEDHWKGKTEADFIDHESHHGLTKIQLREAFNLMNQKKKPSVIDAIAEKVFEGIGTAKPGDNGVKKD